MSINDVIPLKKLMLLIWEEGFLEFVSIEEKILKG